MNPKLKNKFSYFLFIFPALFIFLNVVMIPFIIGIIYSLTNWDGFQFAGSKFVGFENYLEVFKDKNYIKAFLFSFKYSFFMLVLVNLIGFSLALLVTSKIRGKNALRSVFLMPNLIGGLILGFIWKFIFTRLLPELGSVTGMENIFFDWLKQENSAFTALVIVGVWQQAGYVMIIYIAGLQAIPHDMMEAAGIDGASSWQKLIRITIPLMIPSFTINLFVTLSNAMKQYDTNVSLTNGDPAGKTEMIAMNIYNSAFKYRDSAEAQAKAIIFFVVIFVISLVQLNITRKREIQL